MPVGELVLLSVALLTVLAWWSFRHVGQELFPDVDSSEFTLHVRAAGGPRVEETERQVEEIEDLLLPSRQVHGACPREESVGENQAKVNARRATWRRPRPSA